MYSRYSEKSNAAIQIPDHYSGCAFPKATPNRVTHTESGIPSRVEIAKPSAPTAENASAIREERTDTSREPPRHTEVIPVHERQERAEKQEKKEPSAQTAAPFPGRLGNLGAAFPFSHGIGFEELLILGLILLLSKSDRETDLIPMLGLLLFCG